MLLLAKLLTILYFCKQNGKKRMNVQIESTWKEHLQGEFDKPYFGQLTNAVRQ